MKSKTGTCKINDCTIIEARKPLKFFNSLFLLRTSANTIACTAVVHIQDALNGKEVDWPALFYALHQNGTYQSERGTLQG